MEDNILAWNIPNWITVLLMVALGYLTIALVSQLIGNAPGGGPAVNIFAGIKQQLTGAQQATSES